MVKKLLILVVTLTFLFSQNICVFSQDAGDDFGDFEDIEGELSDEITLGSGGSIIAKCTGNVPFRKLVVKDEGFNNILVDPETGKLQLTIDIEKTTDKNILGFNFNVLLDPEESINKLLQGKPLPLNSEDIMFSLTSTDLETGETINVTNEVRRLVEDELTNEGTIDTQRDIPIKGLLKMQTKNNLASGIFQVVFENTNKVIEKASDVIGEPITIDENGKASAIGRFTNIPINGSFADLAGIDLENLPIKLLEKLPQGIDINNLPPNLNITSFASGIDFSDLTNIPIGFDLMDLIDLPPGFNINDLTKIPPGFGVGDLPKLPSGFNLNDFVKIPPDLDLSNIPPGFSLDDLIQLPFGTLIGDLPSGFTPEDIKNIPPGFGPEDISKLPPGFDPSNLPPGIDPGSIPDVDSSDPSVVCEDGMIKPGFEQFLPPGFICPPTNLDDGNG
ncbi:MAG: hypothetical protein HYZ79_04330 [Candidatus Melainabacteria bacterium]|nr:hypothetical protein [Candidatus Melainabacteria bacterium]